MVTKYHLQAVVCVGVLLAFFYNVVVSWALWYLVVSLMSILVPGSRLEWAYCDHSYNNHTTCNHTTTSVEEYWSRNVLAHSDHDWTNYVSSISFYFFSVIFCLNWYITYKLKPCPLSICTWFFQFSSLKYPAGFFFQIWTEFFACKIPAKVVKNVISKWTS